MNKLLAGFLVCTGLLFGASGIVSVEDNIKELKSMNAKQRAIMYGSFRYGFNKDFGVTMALIAWQESKAGKYKINLSDPSFGTYHNLLSSVMSRQGVRDTAYYRNKYANKLMQNETFAKSQALAELLHWESYHIIRTGRAGLWQKTVRSYNAGGYWKGKDADAYFQNIKNKLEAVKQTGFFNNLKAHLVQLKLNNL